MLLNLLKDFVNQKRLAGWPDFVIKNALKEYLQFPVLAFLYSQKDYREFIFMGGSALRIIYGLPRLSEDLDFNLPLDVYNKLDLTVLGEDIKKYFSGQSRLAISYRVQGKERLYLKFPILKDLGLAEDISKSNFLYVKIELSAENFKAPEYEINPVSGFGFNFIVKTYTLKFLMTGKINAIFSRAWFKGKENEIDIKGRDYYDLFWYLDKGIEPDFAALAVKPGINNMAELKARLKEKIKTSVTAVKLRYDLVNFFNEQKFINNFCDNYSEIMKKYLD
ncbi:MAG: nucleotidyl transferase AbiEii/AbiGii toxin family protein [bacterium]